MTKLLFFPKYKNWFKGAGLHHASISFVPLTLGLIVDYFGNPALGAFIASGGFWWYASREYGYGVKPPPTFEAMDFISPAIVASSYFWLRLWINHN